MIRLLLIGLLWLPVEAEEFLRTTRIRGNTVRFYLSPEFTKAYVRHALTLTYPEEVRLEELPPSIVEVPLITNTIAVIWLSGRTYTIEEMDEDLYYSLMRVKEFFKRFF